LKRCELALGQFEAAVIPVVLGNGSQGIPVDQLGKVLAQYVPAAVDHARPDGKRPHTAQSPGAGSRLPQADSPIVAGRGFIALKNLQNSPIWYVPM
jgi:hypothetical protein